MEMKAKIVSTLIFFNQPHQLSRSLSAEMPVNNVFFNLVSEVSFMQLQQLNCHICCILLDICLSRDRYLQGQMA